MKSLLLHWETSFRHILIRILCLRRTHMVDVEHMAVHFVALILAIKEFRSRKTILFPLLPNFCFLADALCYSIILFYTMHLAAAKFHPCSVCHK